jgi:Tol biopolymer transport system component
MRRSNHALTHNAASETRSGFAPTWSPGGQHIAFAQFDSRDSLYICSADQRGANHRQFSAGDRFDFLPDWACLARVI